MVLPSLLQVTVSSPLVIIVENMAVLANIPSAPLGSIGIFVDVVILSELAVVSSSKEAESS